ncbi:hypothetical protein [Apibacter adventoris]|uniref:Uncharacterized protein n=1 Tax=Apibacter adventoris TaxID=1679466 RepID=A0A2S8AFA1_9FLAO|nr:hypothetical protein [Apibacter adventoris]PQL94633.1 hypothetical protein C4S77_02940 [Apibacter adventoris]
MKFKILYKILIITMIFGVFLIYLSSYIGWYGYEKWKYRRSTRGDIEQSKMRKVFVKQVPFIVVPDTIKTEGMFYIEKGYTYGKHSMEDTRVLTMEDTKYPFQLMYKGFSIIYLKKDNPNMKDSIHRDEIWLKSPIIRDTIYYRLLKSKGTNVVDPQFTDTIGMIKVFDK